MHTIINKNGFIRMTRQRRLILEALSKSTSHPTADELHNEVRQTLPHISLGTIYRNLEMMATAGLVQRVEGRGAQWRFDGNTSEHHHVRCTGCDRVADVQVEHHSHSEFGVVDAAGYKIAGSRIDFFGLCPKCQQQAEKHHHE